MTGEPGGHEPAFIPPQRPLLVVLSGPSGVGKDAVLARLRESSYPFFYVTTLTTRARRPGEKDGIDYRFVSVDEFQVMRDNNALLESANVYGNWYGVPRAPVKDALERGQDVIIKIDVQGAGTIRKIAPQAVLIFLTTPTLEELRVRLERRLTESTGQLALRLKTAEEEMKQASLFDYLVVNHEDRVDEAVGTIEAIVIAEKSRVHPREIVLP